ncbi:MAG: hypothetical protein KF709_09690 [Gemmatimonadaceae bacterium]|nr:hypothetical protein [Gemmatimonadaceae bacterium]
MRLELAERLRCPGTHAATPLVVVAQRTVERELLDGVAGCPVCRLEARFADGDLLLPGASDSVASTDALPGEEELLRLVALLGLAEPGGAVLLVGNYARFAAALVAEIDVRAVVLGAAPRTSGVSAVRGAQQVLPFSDATFRAAAIGASTPMPLLLDVVRGVAPGGRVVGALPLERPASVRELARDEREWVGEVERGASGIVPLRRA